MAVKPDDQGKVLCPRCKHTFECLPGNISACWCSGMTLSREEFRFISLQFDQCLCSACITSLKEEYASLNLH